jgi:hypothetical protein
MTETILRLLTRLSEAGSDAILTGEMAKPFQGPAFERLLARRIIIEDAPLTEWEVCDRCDCGLASRRIRSAGDNRFRAECPLDRRQDVDLTEDDLRVYRVRGPALASAISAVAGFGESPHQLVDGFWQLGTLPSGRIVFLALEPAALNGGNIAATLRQAAQGQDVAILAPAIPPSAALRLREARFHLVETLAVMMPVSGGFGFTIDPASLSLAPATATLRVRTRTAEVQWAGRSVILSHQLFPVFQRLLEKALTRDKVASASHVEGTTGREAKDLIREVRSAFRAAGCTDAESKNLIVTVRSRGYRLGIPSDGIVVDD